MSAEQAANDYSEDGARQEGKWEALTTPQKVAFTVGVDKNFLRRSAVEYDSIEFDDVLSHFFMTSDFEPLMKFLEQSSDHHVDYI